MAEYKKEIASPSLEVNLSLFNKLESLYNSLTRKQFERKRLLIRVDYGNSESVKFDNFEEALEGGLPRNIKSIRVEFETSSGFTINKDEFSVSLRFDAKKGHSSSCVISAGNDALLTKIEKALLDIFEDYKQSSAWLYSMRGFPPYFFAVLTSILFTIVVYQIISPISNNKEIVGFVSYTSVMFFSFINYQILTWLFPLTNFSLREKVTNKRKFVKLVSGTVLLGLLINALWFIIQRLISNG